MHRRWWPAVVVGTVVVVFSLVPLGGGGATAGPDKLLHVVDYAALAFALGYAVRARRWTTLVTVAVAAAAVGGVVELLQGPIPTRDTSLVDAAANTLGAALGTAGWWVTRRTRRVERDRA